ncbi:MAG: hypothetical protein ACJAYF_000301 [Arenicella sp.]|jgi:hypothetical protein
MRIKPNVQLKKITAVMLGVYALGAGQVNAQQIAILDSGVDPQPSFNLVQGFDYFNNDDDTSDKSGDDDDVEAHGTATVRLATESFSGEIVPFVITDGASEDVDQVQVRTARDSALSDILGRSLVRVIGITNNSLGVTNSSAPLISNLSGAGKVIAITAGDGGSTQPNALSTSSFNLSGVVIVGATDASGELLPGSNQAGTTSNKYVAVNGLLGNDPDSTEGDTSYATARLSGIAGAVLLQNPDLTAEEVVEVILISAEDRGEDGTDSVYGRGVILNAQQVLNNVIGPVVVPTPPVTPPAMPAPSSGGGGGGGGGAILLVGGALAGVLLLNRKSSTKLEKTLVLDSYGRSFEADLSQQVEINDGALHLNQFFYSLKQQAANSSVGSQVYLPRLKSTVAFQATALVDPRIDMIEYFAMPGDVGIEAKNKTVSLAVESKLSQRFDFSAGYNVSPNQEFGGAKNLERHSRFGASSFITGQSFGSVLSGFSTQANTSSLSYRSSDKSSIKLGLVSVDQTERFNQTSLSALLEGSYQFTDNAGMTLQFGQIKENGSVLGGGASGVLGVDHSLTYALNLSGNIKATNKLSVVGNYGVGRTRVESSDSSLLNDFSTLTSDWYSLGLIGNNIFRTNDQIGFAFSQPLKVRSGSVNYSIPVGRLDSGRIGFDTERVNLSDTNATEQTLEAYYRTMLNHKLEVGGFISYRKNPNHISDGGDEGIIMATVRYWQ